MMSTQRLIRLYQSKPIWEMDRSSLLILRRGMGEWIWLKGYNAGGKKREELDIVLHHIGILLGKDEFAKLVMRSLF